MRTLILKMMLLSCISSAYAQVTIGSSSPPDPAAVLDLQSTQGGLLIPRLTTQQRNALPAPPNGLQIYNTDINCLEMYFPSGWKPVMCDCSTAPATPSAISGAAQVCLGATAQVFSIPAVPMATSYNWQIDPQDTLVSGQGTTSIVVHFSNNSGPRNIQVQASNFCGVSSPTTHQVLVNNPSAGFTYTPNPIITNNAGQFTPNFATATSYSWIFNGGNPASSVSAQPQVTWNTPGTYPVSLVVTDAFGCTDSQAVQVNVINCQPFSHTFTPCGAQGKNGPSQGQCDATYGAGFVTVTGGIQYWTVPATGVYEIEVAGADGSHNGTGYGGGGRGAILKARFTLTQGTVLKLLVGQRGKHGTSAGGGGGGTFVATSANVPLIVAGGGGSSRSGATLNYSYTDAVTTTCGRAGTGSSGGCSGNGAAYGGEGPGGAGFTGNGPAFYDTRSMCVKTIAYSFVNGGTGGELWYDCGTGVANQVIGGFGGGAGSGWGGAAGGGGYSGGGAGTNATNSGFGGGGGSYIDSQATNVATSDGKYENSTNFNGSAIQNLGTYNQNNGYIKITRICQ